MCWETSLTKCYPLRNNRATITSFIVLGLTLGLGPGRDAKLIFTNGDLTANIYSSHSASQPPLYNTKYEMVQMLYLTGIYFDIFCNFLVNGAALAVSKQHPVWMELMTNCSWSAVEPCLSCPGHISDSESAGKMKMISLMICLPSRCHQVAKTPHFPPLQ